MADKAIKQQDQVKEIFKVVSQDYDHMNDIISLGTHKNWRHQLNNMIPFTKDMEVLDVATGTGDWAIATAPQVKHLTGLDYSPDMLEKARPKIAKAGLTDKITLVEGDGTDMPFESNTFDIVTIGFGLRNMPSPEAGLKELVRVVKPGGIVVIFEASQVDNPIIRPFWHFYMTHIIPLFGRTFSDHPDEFIYLHQTIDNFVSKKQLKKLMEQFGLTNVKYKNFMLGSAAVHFGRKPADLISEPKTKSKSKKK
ncbi:MAG: bifunctional demethylmenaquinone methyltransferase/2-methoxy-6-polyprenyl-1,4-benzoquinol methylase UbiE [Lactobacillaceae bacterium]|jgi:demethylmenaquinone methyltransferase/2-methoxy-6-polyprenyl-1,4-benzoquinol methylase|nr:bifunctional demethylmenaquinone methyltransferase/2-methoxy-6-polyprenyl-1,4-benzoquinol methylase UbiE [Lactobacillaceae bacterium]